MARMPRRITVVTVSPSRRISMMFNASIARAMVITSLNVLASPELMSSVPLLKRERRPNSAKYSSTIRLTSQSFCWLCDMKPANKGITENTIKVNLKGLLLDFFECLASPEIGVNILSFTEVEKKFKISYVRNKAFVVHLPNRDLWIHRARESRSVHATLTNSVDW